jgi:hypothetical protein
MLWFSETQDRPRQKTQLRTSSCHNHLQQRKPFQIYDRLVVPTPIYPSGLQLIPDIGHRKSAPLLAPSGSPSSMSLYLTTTSCTSVPECQSIEWEAQKEKPVSGPIWHEVHLHALRPAMGTISSGAGVRSADSGPCVQDSAGGLDGLEWGLREVARLTFFRID